MSDRAPTVPTLSTLRRRRGVVRASVTRLATRLSELESKSCESTTASLAQRMSEGFQLIKLCSSEARSVATRRLSQFKASLSAVNTAITALTGDAKEVHLVYLYQEQLSDYKKELGDIRHDITSQCTLEESDELNTTVTTLDKEIFDLSLIIKRLLYISDLRSLFIYYIQLKMEQPKARLKVYPAQVNTTTKSSNASSHGTTVLVSFIKHTFVKSLKFLI